MKIINESLLDEFRQKTHCEWCRRSVNGCDPHHIWAKGMGGGGRLDVRWNIAAVCRVCHGLIHSGHVTRSDILAVVAVREGVMQHHIENEIYRLRRLPKNSVITSTAIGNCLRKDLIVKAKTPIISRPEQEAVTLLTGPTQSAEGGLIMSDQSITTHVTFKLVPKFPAYRVGDDGSVWTSWYRGVGTGSNAGWVIGGEWRKMTFHPNSRGRLYVLLSAGERREKNFQVAHLVLIAFVGPRPDGMECCHEDDNYLNNSLANLRWDTTKENVKDKIKNHRVKNGAKHHWAKLTRENVIEILEELKTYERGKKKRLAEKFGVSPTAISHILKGNSWSQCLNDESVEQ